MFVVSSGFGQFSILFLDHYIPDNSFEGRAVPAEAFNRPS
jgi:hypothetical protein